MKIKDLAVGFQQSYFNDKYEIDQTLTSPEDLDLFNGLDRQGYINYIRLSAGNPIQSVYNIIEGNLKNRVRDEAINDITVLGAELRFLQLFEAFYRYKTERGTSTMFETYEIMFLLAMQYKRDLAQNLISELEGVIQGNNRGRTSDSKLKDIAPLFACYELYAQFPEELEVRFNLLCERHGCNESDFKTLVKRYESEYNKIRDYALLNPDSISTLTVEERKDLEDEYDKIRDNKKYNFQMDTGCIKISTIHSFKGWESDTVFLILQPKHETSTSFDELLYTGITRARSNLVIINLGNEEYHEKMKELVNQNK